jgi:hypothetical protein
VYPPLTPPERRIRSGGKIFSLINHNLEGVISEIPHLLAMFDKSEF